MKLLINICLVLSMVSRPARGAWIEIALVPLPCGQCIGRAPHGARGLKFCVWRVRLSDVPVAPRTGRVD